MFFSGKLAIWYGYVSLELRGREGVKEL